MTELKQIILPLTQIQIECQHHPLRIQQCQFTAWIIHMSICKSLHHPLTVCLHFEDSLILYITFKIIFTMHVVNFYRTHDDIFSHKKTNSGIKKENHVL